MLSYDPEVRGRPSRLLKGLPALRTLLQQMKEERATGVPVKAKTTILKHTQVQNQGQAKSETS